MKIVRFAIEVDGKPEIQRVIDIPIESTFEELHLAILASVDFDSSQLASFFLCDNEWDRKLEITLLDMESEDSDFTPVMRDTELEDYITDKGQKLIYEYDFVLMWRFLMEVQDIFESKEDASVYPLLVFTEGDSPEQYAEAKEIIGNITDEDSMIINHLAGKNHEFFSGEEDENADEYGDLYDTDDLDGFGEDYGSSGRYNDDEY